MCKNDMKHLSYTNYMKLLLNKFQNFVTFKK